MEMQKQRLQPVLSTIIFSRQLSQLNQSQTTQHVTCHVQKFKQPVAKIQISIFYGALRGVIIVVFIICKEKRSISPFLIREYQMPQLREKWLTSSVTCEYLWENHNNTEH